MRAFEHVEKTGRTLFVFGKYSNRHLIVTVDKKNQVNGKRRPWVNLLEVKDETTPV